MPLYPPRLEYDWKAPDRTYFGESFDILNSTGATALPTAGRVELVRIKVPLPCSVTNVVVGVGTAGSSLTSGQCFAALYTSAGSLIGQSSDQTAAWGGTGLKAAALAGGPFSLGVGEYYGAVWFNGTTGPQLARILSANANIVNAGRAAPNLLVASADTSITTTAPPTLGAQTVTTTVWWMALS